MNMPDVVCNNCTCPGRLPTGQVVTMNRPMELIEQFPVHGVHTYALHCTGCNGKAYLQQRMNQQTKQPEFVQVQLRGAESEYKPNHVKPHERVQIPVAYTLGGQSPSPPIQLPEVGLSLDPRIGDQTLITPDHPMHPEAIRRRMQPVRLSEFTGGG